MSIHVVNPLPMNTALFYYNQFMDNYSFPHTYNGKLYTHSIPSSFLYNTIRDGCTWLVTLIVGVAGYSVYFDSDTETSRVLSLSQLNQSGVKDPVLQYNQTVQPWEGLLSDGRSPMEPTDKISDGLGIASINGPDLLPIYSSYPLQAVLPEYDSETGAIVYDDSGVMQTKRYTFCTRDVITDINQYLDSSDDADNRSVSGGDYETESFPVYMKDKYIYNPIYGWGMGYKVTKKVNNGDSLESVTYSKSLPLDTVNDDLTGLCYTHNSQGIYCLKCIISGKYVKRIGADFGKSVGSTRNLSRLEFSSFSEYAKYHLTDSRDRFYVPLYWMSKNWAPFLSWHDGTQTNSLQVIMMASAVSTFNKISQSELQGKSVNAISSMFIDLGLSQKEKDQFRKVVANTHRVISLLEFLRRV